MFVLKSKYSDLLHRHVALIGQWNKLVERYEAMGEAMTEKRHASQFSDEDLRRLLMLCHPDKHNGKQMAADMTAKLNSMRK